MDTHTFTARWVFPVASPPLPNGTITVRDRVIEAVLPRGERTPDTDFGNTAIIPGLVNAHTHLDLSGALGLIPPTNPHHFTDWLRAVIAYRLSRSPEQVQADIRAGLAECLRFGTTLIGDIAAGGDSWDALASAPARSIVFREVIGLTPDGVNRWHEAEKWAAGRDSLETCRPGYSPHAPYSANANVLRKAVKGTLPVAIHLAETPAEIELLAHRTGPFVEFLKRLGIWDNAVLAESQAWLVDVTANGGTAPLLYAHANYLPRDTRLPAHVSIAYCPRTHAVFGHPLHPFREFLARGVRVCLGTDSLASNPDLDLLAEARFLYRMHPDFPGEQLLRMATLAGAEALGWREVCGSLEVGKSADFVIVPLPDRDCEPYELLFADHPGTRRTVFRGEFVEMG